MNIDGYLNEEIWNSSSKIEDFIQVSPKYFVDPSEVTSVHLTYDESFLYIGATLFSDSNSIVKKLGDYDSFEESFENNSDYFVIEIDSDHNHETAYGFSVNAANVKSDYMIYDDAMIDDYWDADWESAVIVDSLKWTVEIKIPFKCMRFNNKIIYTHLKDQVATLEYLQNIMPLTQSTVMVIYFSLLETTRTNSIYIIS